MWTDKQLCAINAPVGNILVTAAAGSGKTAVMVERIIERITGDNGIDVDRMLIVTFTNAAAAEIKDRIMKAVIKKLDEGENKKLRRQLVLINNASICTIHSFCLDVIRSNFDKIDLSPDFKIGAENDCAILLDNAIDAVFEDYYKSGNEAFENLVRCYTSRDDAPLADIIKKLYLFSRSIPDSDGWLKKHASTDIRYAFPVMLELCREMSADIVSMYSKIINWCRLDKELLGKIAFFEEEQLPFVALVECVNWDRAYEILNNAKFNRLVLPKGAPEDIVKRIKDTRNNLKNMYKKICISYITAPENDILSEMDIVSPNIRCMCEVTINVAREYTRVKRQKNIVDFSDIEHMCLQIIADKGLQTDAGAEIMNRFDEIYIDEYQDCNSVQEEIFSAISGKNKDCPNIFAVGDMKQSIYKFRDANPKLFKNKSDVYPEYDPDNYQPESKITLNTNFRSRSQVIDCVNSVFRQLMTVGAGEMDYTEEEYLYPGSVGYTEINSDQLCADLVIVKDDSDCKQNTVYVDDESADQEQTDEVIEYTKEVAEAMYIANRINQMVSDADYKIYDKHIDGFRQIEYRDIVILMRGIRSNASAFSQVFKQCGIPLFVDVNGYFDAPEIDFLINFLRIIDNPLDDIPLVATMHHPLFGFTDNELLTIRYNAGKCKFYKAVKAYCAKDDYLGAKCGAFVRLLTELWQKSKYFNVNELLEYAISKTNYMVYLSAVNNSALAKSNVRMLFTKAKEFESNNFKGIFNFVNYIDNIRNKGKDADSAKPIGENDNVVRVMTIHKSKGLEFPVVFLARTTTKFNKRDMSSTVLMHKDYGIGTDVIDYKRRITYPSFAKNALKTIMLAESISEELRILYVALTRAREKLIVVGYHNDPSALINIVSDKISGCGEVLPKSVVLSANTYMELMLMSVLRNPSCDFEQDVYPELLKDERAVFNCKIEGAGDFDRFQQVSADVVAMPMGTDNADDAILHNLSFLYPYEQMCHIPANISVTELKQMAYQEEVPAYALYGTTNLARPSFVAESKTVSGAHKGTLMHYVMQKIDFMRSEVGEVQAQLDDMLARRQITSAEHKAINPEDISSFISSPLGKDIVAHYDSFCREYSFKYLMKANEIFETASDDDIIVQGVIDAFYVNDNGNIVLIDYKTDKIVTTEEDTAKKYETQLKYYAIAIEKILNKQVESRYIHLFETRKTIKM